MGWKKKFCVSAIMSLACPVMAAAQTVPTDVRLPDIPAFTPSLTINEDSQICEAYKTAWMDVYKSDKPLSPVHLDLRTAFPQAEQIFPPADAPQMKPFYGKAQGVPFDYDGDGDEEILYIVGDVSNWRSTGVRFFIYDNRADFDADAVAKGEKDRRTPRSQFGYMNTENTKAKILASYPRLGYPHLFKIDGKLYSKSNVTRRSHMPISASLDWLRPGEEAKPVCEIELTGEHSLGTEAGFEFYTRLSEIYGGPEKGGMCYGTMGWTASPVYSHLPNLLYRPQAMRQIHGTQIDMSTEADTAREFRFAAWGIQDPTSLSVIDSLKRSYPRFIAELTLYYQLMLGMDAAEGKNTAERAYRYMLDNVYYARQTGPQWLRDDYAGLEVGPATSLGDIAALALAKANFEKKGSLSLLKLGLMTRQSAEALTPLIERLLSDEHWFFKLSNEDAATKMIRKKQMVNQMFLASLKSPEMMTLLLGKGADVDVTTNYFGKTALMYAAQNNDVEAAMLLLAQGANPNSRTQSESGYCQTPLTRDARTPLMYAAENADPQLILILLEAGADRTAKDSKGNDVFWYLERHVGLSGIEKSVLRARLTR